MNKFSSKSEPFVLSKFNKSILLALLLSTALLGCASGSSNEYSSPDYSSSDIEDYVDPCAADPCAAEDYAYDPCAADPCAAEDYTDAPSYEPGELAFTPEEIELMYALSQVSKEERIQILGEEREEYFSQNILPHMRQEAYSSSTQPYPSSPTYTGEDYLELERRKAEAAATLEEARNSHRDDVIDSFRY